MATREPASMLLDDQLCFALYSTTQAIQRLYRPLLSRLGLTYPQYLVLLVLWEEDGLTVSQIGDRLSLNSATLTPLLKRIERAGIVERTRLSSDERRVSVVLTQSGRDLQLEVGRVTTDVTCAAVDAAEDAHELRANLVTLRDQLPQSLD